jgi:hypothetical protein
LEERCGGWTSELVRNGAVCHNSESARDCPAANLWLEVTRALLEQPLDYFKIIMESVARLLHRFVSGSIRKCDNGHRCERERSILEDAIYYLVVVEAPKRNRRDSTHNVVEKALDVFESNFFSSI